MSAVSTNGLGAVSVLPAMAQQWQRQTGTAGGGETFVKVGMGSGVIGDLIGIQVNAAGASKTGYAQFFRGTSTVPVGPSDAPYTPPWADGSFTVAPVENVGSDTFYVKVFGITAASAVEVFALYRVPPSRC